MKHVDKLKHFGVFLVAGFGSMWLLAALWGLDISYPWRHAAVTVAGIAAAFITEDRQRHQSGRVKDGWDAFADLTGVSLGVICYNVLIGF